MRVVSRLSRVRRRSLRRRDLAVVAFGVHLEDRDLDRLVHREVVDADDRAVVLVDLALVAEGGVGDLALEEAVLDGGEDAAEVLDLAEVGVGLGFGVVGQLLDEVAAAERVDGVGDAGLVGDDLLGAQGEACGLLAGQGERLVHRVGVQATACRRARRPAPGSRCGRG